MKALGFEITREAKARTLEAQDLLAFAQTTDPRKLERGTSYEASGTIKTDGSYLREFGSAGGGQIREVVPALGTRRQALQTYNEMSNNDASVDVSLRSAKIPVQGAEYFMEPFDDRPENLDIAEFCSYNLLEGTSAPFLLVLEDILRMYEDGVSVLEPTYELREWAPRRSNANRRRYTMLKKLGYRPTLTIKEFLYDDNGGPTGITHLAVRADGKPEEVEIPIEKLVIFPFNKKGGNLEGKSLLRTAYKHWYYVNNLEKIDAIQKERHALGIPKAKLVPGYTDIDRAAAWKLVTELRTNEKAGMVLPPGFDIEFAKVEGQLVDVLKSVEHHRSMIMLNVMVQFLLLGLLGGGGRATSGSHQNMFEKSLKYVANYICETINLHLVPKLVGFNFDTDKFPKLRVRNVGEGKDIQMWASALANLASQHLITLDLETEQWVRRQMDIPAKMGGKQTPEANAAAGDNNNKGGVQSEGETDRSGNVGKADDEG